MIKPTIHVNDKAFQKAMFALQKQATQKLISVSVKKIGGVFVKEVYNPRIMPIDLGRARAGAKRGFLVTGQTYNHVGYAKGHNQGSRLSGARLSKMKFESSNKVIYAGELDQEHSGRKAAWRYKPKRFVQATGSKKGFVKIGLNKTLQKAPQILKPLVFATYGKYVPIKTGI